jgi:hypothetical protein
MTIWTAMVLITLIASVAGVIGSVASARYRAKNGLRVDWMGNEIPVLGENSGENAALQQEVQQLRDRVRVLERIVTDGHEGNLLSEQIESLRDR